LRHQLRQDVEGYTKLTGDYETLSKIIEDIETQFSMPWWKVPDRGKALGRIFQLLKDTPTSDFKGDLLLSLGKAIDVPMDEVLPAVAGRVMSQTVARNLIGREIMAGLAYEAFDLGGTFLALQLFFVIPRLAGEVLSVVGYTKRQVTFANQMYKDITSRLPKGTYAEGMTLMEVLNRMEKEGLQGQEPRAGQADPIDHLLKPNVK